MRHRPSILEQLAEAVREAIECLQELRLNTWKEGVELLREKGLHILRCSSIRSSFEIVTVFELCSNMYLGIEP